MAKDFPRTPTIAVLSRKSGFSSKAQRRGGMFTFKLILGTIANPAIFAILLFLPAGTWHWWRAWLLIAIFFVGAVWAVLSLLHGGHKDLLEERLKSPVQKGQPLADKVVVLLLLVTYFGDIAFIPLDVFHLHLLSKPGPLVSSLGLILFNAGWWIAYLSLRENAFAAPVVKRQTERNQTVVDTGVYSKIRHPMYAGAALVMIGVPLWLESCAATLLSLIPISTLLLRIFIEEQFLRRELQGYDAYTKRVPYRLIPYLW
jgi:protein-S-isoprenylcysteine O-methyltransferase Ste14